jgi:hypothetical protein
MVTFKTNVGARLRPYGGKMAQSVHPNRIEMDRKVHYALDCWCDDGCRKAEADPWVLCRKPGRVVGHLSKREMDYGVRGLGGVPVRPLPPLQGGRRWT